MSVITLIVENSVQVVNAVLVLDFDSSRLRIAQSSVCSVLERTPKPDEQSPDTSRCRAEVGSCEAEDVQIEKACACRTECDPEHTYIDGMSEDSGYAVHLSIIYPVQE